MAKVRRNFIHTREYFLNEAKLREVLLPVHKKKVASQWGAEFLDMEEVEPTPNIIQGEWLLSEEDKLECFQRFFSVKDLSSVFGLFSKLPEDFVELFHLTFDSTKVRSPLVHPKTFEKFDIHRPTFEQMSALFEKLFRKISVNDTLSDEVVVKDERGRPVMGEDGKPVRKNKEKGELVISDNYVNFVNLLDDYMRIKGLNPVTEEMLGSFAGGDIANIRKVLMEGKHEKSIESKMNGYRVDFDVFNKDLYLYIKHDPSTILNMSLSSFFSSCTHLYHGDSMDTVLSNVFDTNSVPAFLLFKTPIHDKNNTLLSSHLPLCRRIIRNIENEDDKTVLYFDKSYPNAMSDVMGDMIEKYSGNIETESYLTQDYVFAPDLPDRLIYELPEPYMDTVSGIKKKPIIGKNTKTLYLNNIYEWDRVRIPKDNNLDTVIIETTVLPTNFTDLGLSLTNLRIRTLFVDDVKSLNVSPERVIFEKCILDTGVLSECVVLLGVKSIHLESCDLSKTDISELRGVELDELGLIYTMDDPSDLRGLIQGINFHKLVLSGDIMNETNKVLIKELRDNGKKVEIVGTKSKNVR